jgi:hypothetical protein
MAVLSFRVRRDLFPLTSLKSPVFGSLEDLVAGGGAFSLYGMKGTVYGATDGVAVKGCYFPVGKDDPNFPGRRDALFRGGN